MNVLVTGATGFLGSHIVDACRARGDRVRALVRTSSDTRYLRSLGDVELVPGDVADSTACFRAAQDVDVVYHSAARVSDYGSRQQFWDANVVGTEHLLAAAQLHRARRFVFVSSPSVVGDDKDQVDIDESYPYPKRFLNLYSETKAAAEQLVLRASTKGFVACAIRPRGVWGPRDRTGWMPKLVAKMAAGRLPDMSGGRKVYASICHAENAAAACVLAGQSDAVGGKAYFVTDGEKTDVWGFAQVIADLFGIAPPRRRIHPALLRVVVAAIEALWKIPALGHRYSPPISRYAVSLLTQTGTYDIRAAERDFGYRPRIDSRVGLQKMRAWVDEIGGLPEFVRYAS